jgi:hypothetical protein
MVNGRPSRLIRSCRNSTPCRPDSHSTASAQTSRIGASRSSPISAPTMSISRFTAQRRICTGSGRSRTSGMPCTISGRPCRAASSNRRGTMCTVTPARRARRSMAISSASGISANVTIRCSGRYLRIAFSRPAAEARIGNVGEVSGRGPTKPTGTRPYERSSRRASASRTATSPQPTRIVARPGARRRCRRSKRYPTIRPDTTAASVPAAHVTGMKTRARGSGPPGDASQAPVAATVATASAIRGRSSRTENRSRARCRPAMARQRVMTAVRITMASQVEPAAYETPATAATSSATSAQPSPMRTGSRRVTMTGSVSGRTGLSADDVAGRPVLRPHRTTEANWYTALPGCGRRHRSRASAPWGGVMGCRALDRPYGHRRGAVLHHLCAGRSPLCVWSIALSRFRRHKTRCGSPEMVAAQWRAITVADVILNVKNIRSTYDIRQVADSAALVSGTIGWS